MNFPSASPNENMKTPSSIRPMPASRAERSSEVDGFAREVMLALSSPGSVPGLSCAVPCCFKGVAAGSSSGKTRFALLPGHDELNQLSQAQLCDTGTSTKPDKYV